MELSNNAVDKYVHKKIYMAKKKSIKILTLLALNIDDTFEYKLIFYI